MTNAKTEMKIKKATFIKGKTIKKDITKVLKQNKTEIRAKILKVTAK